MPWTITNDCRKDAAESAVGVLGPRSAGMNAASIANHPDAREFHILCGDAVCFKGKAVRAKDESPIAPLDGFAAHIAPATAIRYPGWLTIIGIPKPYEG
jgi:hypothetical protein